MVIGICDDVAKDRERIYRFCEAFFRTCDMEHQYRMFASGEEVLEYCRQKDQERVDLLFLDIELGAIDGIQVKDRILRQDMVWRIVFVSGNQDKVFLSFGLKTLGFLVKPAGKEDICRWINVVLEELKEDILVTIADSKTADERYVRLEDIEYFVAEGNYTKIVLHTDEDSEEDYILVTKKIGELEQEYSRYPILRVHKSYMVNLENVMDIKGEITIRDSAEKIPIGRTFKDSVRKKYLEFGKEKVRGRT
ncbi:MAG: LytTR family DNA-binding domain-containing protein [Roseburia sp.]|nr:LytTR family DNA-binding domain-containing protein [Roseburia sp.]